MEYKNLIDIERQIIAVNAFLFKGTKETKAIGEKEGLDLYDLEKGKIIKVKKVFVDVVETTIKKTETLSKKMKTKELEKDERKEDDEMDNESKEDYNSGGGVGDSDKEEMDSPRASRSPD